MFFILPFDSHIIHQLLNCIILTKQAHKCLFKWKAWTARSHDVRVVIIIWKWLPLDCWDAHNQRWLLEKRIMNEGICGSRVVLKVFSQNLQHAEETKALLANQLVENGITDGKLLILRILSKKVHQNRSQEMKRRSSRGLFKHHDLTVWRCFSYEKKNHWGWWFAAKVEVGCETGK